VNKPVNATLKQILLFQFLKNVRNFANEKILIPMKKEIISIRQKKTARYAKALGHPIRIYVLELLSRQSCCYSGDLSDILPIAKSTLSQHLKELKAAGLIQGEIEAPRIKYCLNRENWQEAQDLFKNFMAS
jgi:DNA-binding HxlR family transcriptional regulator